MQFLSSFVLFLSPSKCVFPRWGAYFSSAPLNFDQVFERECFFSRGAFAGGDIPRGVLQKMGPMHFHRVLHCFLPARICCFSSARRTIWIFCATSRIIMRFFVDFGLGRGRAYIFYPPWSNCGSWAGFCTPGRSWRLLGWILRSLEASRRGFWLSGGFCAGFCARGGFWAGFWAGFWVSGGF